MMCQKCNNKPATVYYTQIINGERIDIRLCEECAKENTQAEYPFTLNDFLTGLFDVQIGYPVNKKIKGENIKCPMCGITFEDFKHTGKMGCSECYNTFESSLESILKRLHGNSRHIGKYPKRVSGKMKQQRDIEDLQAQLEKAIREEKYEKAAELRDRIKDLEKTQK